MSGFMRAFMVQAQTNINYRGLPHWHLCRYTMCMGHGHAAYGLYRANCLAVLCLPSCAPAHLQAFNLLAICLLIIHNCPVELLHGWKFRQFTARSAARWINLSHLCLCEITSRAFRRHRILPLRWWSIGRWTVVFTPGHRETLSWNKNEARRGLVDHDDSN